MNQIRFLIIPYNFLLILWLFNEIVIKIIFSKKATYHRKTGVEQTLDTLFMSNIPYRMDSVSHETGIMKQKLSLTIRES